MGRKTFESFPNRFNRTHIVISRQENYKQGCFVVNSIKKAIEMCPRDELLAEEIYNWDLIVRQNRTYISTS
jgi:dihydrofolate reductase